MADESRVRSTFRSPLKFVGLGEILFDVFEDGAATLGGAPLNVAVHAHQLASALGIGEGIVVSRIGDDASGKQICAALEEHRISTRYLQVDPAHPTGVVSVFMRDGEPGYQIEHDAAWDFLADGSALEGLAQNCDAVCFGSLAQRSAQARETIRAFLASAKHAVRLYDVNLRRNTLTHERGYSAEILEESCRLATLVKVNCAELIEICRLFRIETGGRPEDERIPELAKAFMNRLSIPGLIVTCGPKGTTFYSAQAEFHGRAPIMALTEVYPVGAGDACAAGILVASVLGLSPDAAVDLGNRMGTWVASHRSATPKLSSDIVKFVAELVHGRDARKGDSLGDTA